MNANINLGYGEHVSLRAVTETWSQSFAPGVNTDSVWVGAWQVATLVWSGEADRKLALAALAAQINDEIEAGILPSDFSASITTWERAAKPLGWKLAREGAGDLLMQGCDGDEVRAAMDAEPEPIWTARARAVDAVDDAHRVGNGWGDGAQFFGKASRAARLARPFYDVTNDLVTLVAQRLALREADATAWVLDAAA